MKPPFIQLGVRLVPAFLLLALAAMTLPSSTSAAAYPHDITLTPHNPLPVSTSYHVRICSLKRNSQAVVDTTGPNMFFSRRQFTADSKGCVNYDAVTGAVVGTYGITVHEDRGNNLAVVDWTSFVVK